MSFWIYVDVKISGKVSAEVYPCSAGGGAYTGDGTKRWAQEATVSQALRSLASQFADKIATDELAKKAGA